MNGWLICTAVTSAGSTIDEAIHQFGRRLVGKLQARHRLATYAALVPVEVTAVQINQAFISQLP